MLSCLHVHVSLTVFRLQLQIHHVYGRASLGMDDACNGSPEWISGTGRCDLGSSGGTPCVHLSTPLLTLPFPHLMPPRKLEGRSIIDKVRIDVDRGVDNATTQSLDV
ncbi:hypothetical protein J3459_006387 [Metarhizium acridum]|nr:hypothetical protein J3459_006387 [Metarhizium acridum]